MRTDTCSLGRITNRAINGVSEQMAFDGLNRLVLYTNALGIFSNSYVGGTMLLSTNFYPNGQKTVYSYKSVTNDERLAEIWNLNPTNGTLSKFDYSYDPAGNITNWMQQADTNAATDYSYGYDAGNQLLNVVLNSTGPGATILKQYAYNYDPSGNRTSEQLGTGVSGPVAMSQSAYNVDNQVTSRTGAGGSMLFAGNVNKQAVVTVGGNPALLNHATTNFTGYASVTSGTNVVRVVALDYDNNAATNKYQVVVTNNGVNKVITYDANGNEVSVVTATVTNTYQWDAMNRLVAISGPTNASLFTYDGLGRRVMIVEEANGFANVTNKYLWDGVQLVEQRDATGTTVTKRFFGNGEQIAGVNYYFTRDHLGSVREAVNSSGVMQARYDYDPYGRMNTVAGTFQADFGYAGMYYHAPSGLNLTLYRAYDADLGRWISRDPIGESGGINLYDYVENNSINSFDPLGLFGYPQQGNINSVPSITATFPNGLNKPPCITNNDSDNELAVILAAGIGVELAGLVALGLSGPGETAAAGDEAFWFGEGAQDEAIANGANILQLSPEAEAALNAGNPELMFQESALFAANASGNVTVYVGAGENAGYTFWNYELPQLLNNVNNGTITNLKYIFLAQ